MNTIYQQCVRKKKYRTFTYAKETAKHQEFLTGNKLRVYYCSICNNYHLTHKPILMDAPQ